jgi:hypothetical protein
MKFSRQSAVTFTLEISANSTHHQSIMLASDVHFDSSLCDLKRFSEHLQLANEEKAPVLIAGDFYDAMQGRDDPRRSPEDLKEKYRVSSYFDALVQDASAYLRQYSDVPLWIFGMGNHESKVLEKINTNLLERLAYDMRLQRHNAEACGYYGYIKIIFNYAKGRDKPCRCLYFHHGTGGGAPVTKGVIQVNRQATWLTAPDIVLNGHDHNSWWMPQPVERINDKTNLPYTDAVHFFRTPGYKNPPGEALQSYGFAAEKHRAPTLKGCIFLDLTYHKGRDVPIEIEHRVKIAG